MSKKPKNVIRPAFLMNFTSKVKQRYILLEKGNSQFRNIADLIKSANDTLNRIVQELNIKIEDRQLPYLTIVPCYGNIFDKRVRVFLHNDDTDFLFERGVQSQIQNETDMSHILDFLIAASYKTVTISSLSCDAKLVIDYSLLKCALIDIMLDIVMFNSYSFLKNMNVADKKKFSEQKFAYYTNKNLSCFYDCDDKNVMYYALSFSSRKSQKSFNVDGYLSNWNEFIELFYPNCVHKEKSIKEQLQQHRDIGELPQNLHTRFKDKPNWAYLVLRTTRDRTEDIHPALFSLFGIRKYKRGKIKIVPISDFDKYKPLMEHLDVSAFKIVK